MTRFHGMRSLMPGMTRQCAPILAPAARRITIRNALNGRGNSRTKCERNHCHRARLMRMLSGHRVRDDRRSTFAVVMLEPEAVIRGPKLGSYDERSKIGRLGQQPSAERVVEDIPLHAPILASCDVRLCFR